LQRYEGGTHEGVISANTVGPGVHEKWLFKAKVLGGASDVLLWCTGILRSKTKRDTRRDVILIKILMVLSRHTEEKKTQIRPS